MKTIEVKKLNEFPLMDAGAPTPTILSDEHKVILMFYIYQPVPDWDGTTVHIRENEDTGISAITFRHYAQCRYGNPSDEACGGHRYAKYGVMPYDFYEIINSDLIEELEKMNRVHRSHRKEMFEKYKHYVGFFHDSCFEIVAEEYKIEVFPDKSMTQIIQEKIKTINK